MDTEKKDDKSKYRKYDEEYADLIVFDDQPKRRLKDTDCHESV